MEKLKNYADKKKERQTRYASKKKERQLKKALKRTRAILKNSPIKKNTESRRSGILQQSLSLIICGRKKLVEKNFR